AHHVADKFHCGYPSAFSVARLQHKNLAVLNGEFEVLHVFEMCLEDVPNPLQFDQRFRQMFFQICYRLRSANTSNHILALSVDEKFAVENFLASGGIAGK